MTNTYTKSLPETAHEFKSDLTDFVATRVAMLRSEMGEKLSALKMALPTAAVALVLIWTAWLLLTAFLVTAIATAFSSTWRWVFAFLIVGGVYLILGLLVATSVWTKLKATRLAPERTIRGLKQDGIWLHTEAKTQI